MTWNKRSAFAMALVMVIGASTIFAQQTKEKAQKESKVVQEESKTVVESKILGPAKLPPVKDSPDAIAKEISEIRKALGGGVGSSLQGLISDKESEKLFQDVLREVTQGEQKSRTSPDLNQPQSLEAVKKAWSGAVQVGPRPKYKSRLRPPAGAEKWAKSTQRGDLSSLGLESGSLQQALERASERLKRRKAELAKYNVTKNSLDRKLNQLQRKVDRENKAIEILETMAAGSEQKEFTFNGKAFTKKDIVADLEARKKANAATQSELAITKSTRQKLEVSAAQLRKQYGQSLREIDTINRMLAKQKSDLKELARAKNRQKSVVDYPDTPVVVDSTIEYEPLDPRPQTSASPKSSSGAKSSTDQKSVDEGDRLSSGGKELSAAGEAELTVADDKPRVRRPRQVRPGDVLSIGGSGLRTPSTKSPKMMDSSVAKPTASASSVEQTANPLPQQRSGNPILASKSSKSAALRNAARQLEKIAADLEDIEEYDQADILWNKSRELRAKARKIQD